MPGPLILLLASGLSLPDLTAAAAQSPRPAACQGVSGSGLAVWEAARRPAMIGHCRWLARGYAELSRAPARALLAAERAERALPGQVAPLVLAGRALSALGKHGEAHTRFAAALGRDKNSLEEPAALLAHAQSAERAGKQSAATAAYRALVPRIALLETPWHRQLAAVEAGFSAMDAGELPKAVGVLTEARRRETVPGISDLVAAALALALDRQGRSEEARGVAQEVASVETIRDLAGAKPGSEGEFAPVLAQGQLWACVGLLEANQDRAAAREAWMHFLKSSAGSGRYRAHAQAQLDKLAGVKRSR
ncbi:MAG TPA: hypothetical protein PKA88_28505 [Polyangiaceae bacterium]|nr:hypothetical protein [Polyangiaceae bacterium]HMR74678.1 hypothetical protein [Polyangiaceae bacterium]